MGAIKYSFKSNTQDFARWLGHVPEDIQTDLNKQVPVVKRQTKKVVKDHLTLGNGVDTGIYKRSFIAIDLSENKWHIGFQVVAKKPHYRLTHLLENGHRIKIFTPGHGDMTKKGNIGMSFVSTLRTGARTREIPHIEPGQAFAEDKIIRLYNATIRKNYSERK